MKRILYLILLLVSLTSCGHTQTYTSHEKLTGNIKNDLKLLLPTGTINADELKDLNNLKMKQYKLTIGKLEKNGKTYMSLKGREIEHGVRTVDFEIPIQF